MNGRPEAQASRHRIAALLIAAVPAVTALAMTAAPLTVAATKPHPRTALVADQCVVTLHAGAFDTLKYPQCAGD